MTNNTLTCETALEGITSWVRSHVTEETLSELARAYGAMKEVELQAREHSATQEDVRLARKHYGNLIDSTVDELYADGNVGEGIYDYLNHLSHWQTRTSSRYADMQRTHISGLRDALGQLVRDYSLVGAVA